MLTALRSMVHGHPCQRIDGRPQGIYCQRNNALARWLHSMETMITVAQQLKALTAATANGELADCCRAHSVDLLVQFGSSLTNPHPGEIDLAVGFDRSVEHDLLAFIEALSALVPGDHLDFMDLDRAGPVAQHRALTQGRVLFQASAAAFHERQIFAINHYIETKPLREALLRSLAS